MKRVRGGKTKPVRGIKKKKENRKKTEIKK